MASDFFNYPPSLTLLDRSSNDAFSAWGVVKFLVFSMSAVGLTMPSVAAAQHVQTFTSTSAAASRRPARPTGGDSRTTTYTLDKADNRSHRSTCS
jgi:hypothetical protein